VPGGVTRAYTYAQGRLTSYTENGITTTLAYDATGRLSGLSGGESATFAYDAAGQLTEATTGADSYAYGYDAAGNLVSSSAPGRSRSFTVDAANELSSASDGTQFDYDEAGRLRAIVGPDGTRRTFAYDARGLVVQQVVTGGGGGGPAVDPCDGATPTIVGTESADVLTGTDGDDVIFALAGDDVVDGANGDDLVCGGDGNDRLAGGNGADTLAGGAGDDTLDGANAPDQLFGGAGADTLTGGDGNDTLFGDADGDTLDGGRGDDTLDGGDGNDRLVGDRGADSLDGRAGTDAIDGGQGDDHCEREPGRVSCEVDVVDPGAAETTVITRAYDGDRLLTHVTIARPDETVDDYQLTWDRTGAVPQIASLVHNGERTDLVYGRQRALAVTAGVATPFRHDALGDAVGTAANPLTVADGYGPYGERADGELTVGFGYRGELHVGDLIYLRNRDLDPATGRFTTVDPMPGVPGQTTAVNQYHYADNDPINQIDPLGLRPSDADFTECSALSPLDGWDISNSDAGFFERDRAQQVLARRDSIERWAGANGISSFLLATLIHHEGGNYLDPWRRGSAQAVDYGKLGGGAAGLGSPSVGIANIRPGTAMQVLGERYCGEPDWSSFEVGSTLIESDDFSISIAAGYLRLLKNDYPTADDRALFISYAASRTSNRIMEHFGWDLQRLVNAAAADFYISGRFSVMVGGELLGMSSSTLNTLLRREEHWESSSRAMRRAGW